MQMFRVRLYRNDPSLELAITPSRKLRLLAKLRESMSLAKRLLYEGDNGEGEITEQAQTVLDTVATMKRRFRSAPILWDNFVHCVLADELPKVCGPA